MMSEQLAFEGIRAFRKTRQKNYKKESERAFKVLQALNKIELVRQSRDEVLQYNINPLRFSNLK